MSLNLDTFVIEYVTFLVLLVTNKEVSSKLVQSFNRKRAIIHTILTQSASI